MRDCSSLAVDWLNYNLYWIDESHEAVKMTSLKRRPSDPYSFFNVYRFDPLKSNQKTLVREDRPMRPRSITLHPTKG